MSQTNSNAKWNRYQVGSIRRSNEAGKPSYVLLHKDHFDVLARKFASLGPQDKGVYINLESKEYKKANLEQRIAEGKITNEETIAKARAAVENHPEWCLFELVMLEKNQ